MNKDISSRVFLSDDFSIWPAIKYGFHRECNWVSGLEAHDSQLIPTFTLFIALNKYGLRTIIVSFCHIITLLITKFSNSLKIKSSIDIIIADSYRWWNNSNSLLQYHPCWPYHIFLNSALYLQKSDIRFFLLSHKYPILFPYALASSPQNYNTFWFPYGQDDFSYPCRIIFLCLHSVQASVIFVRTIPPPLFELDWKLKKKRTLHPFLIFTF